VEKDLEEEVTEFCRSILRVAMLEGIQDFVGFLIR